MEEIKILEQIQEIAFYQKYYNTKNIRPENRGKLDFFLFLVFKNKQLQFEKKSLIELFSFLDKIYIENLINSNPHSVPARKIGYFYETIMDSDLDFIGTKATYIKILDEDIFFTSAGYKSTKYKIIDNLLGKINGFNPYIYKTEEINKVVTYDYDSEIQNIIDSKTQYLLEKSVGYLFIKETKSSYQIEGEEYSSHKNSKFLHALQNLEIYNSLEKQNIIDIHNAVMVSKKHEKSFRNFNNYISSGNELMGESIIDYICPDQKNIDQLIQELLDFYNKNRSSINEVLLASIVSSFFVFIHPFSDGNGRTSRYLFHYILKDLGFGEYAQNKNIIIPISAFIVNHRDNYYSSLNEVSKTFWKDTQYDITDKGELEIFGETKQEYLYGDYTKLSEYFCGVFHQSFLTDFKEEIHFLEKYYHLIEEINSHFDFTDKEQGYIGKFLHENNGQLSKAKIKFLEKNHLVLEEDEKEKLENIYSKIFL